MKHETYVYFIRRDSDHTIKIGFSRNLLSRADSLRCKHGKMTLLGVIPGGHYKERQIHFQFESTRMYRKWKRTEFFCPTLELITFIEQNAQWPPNGTEVCEILQREDHSRGERHYCAKLTNRGVFIMRIKYYAGIATIKDMAKEKGVSTATAGAAIRGSSWRHVGGPTAQTWSDNHYSKWFVENPDWSKFLVENA